MSKPKGRPRIPRPPVGPDEHFCTRCLTVKPVGDFVKNKSRPNGLAVWCKACLKRNEDDWKRLNPLRDRQRKAYYSRRQRYGSDLAHIPVGQTRCAIKNGTWVA
jgi:hypothetical protein